MNINYKVRQALEQGSRTLSCGRNTERERDHWPGKHYLWWWVLRWRRHFFLALLIVRELVGWCELCGFKTLFHCPTDICIWLTECIYNSDRTAGGDMQSPDAAGDSFFFFTSVRSHAPPPPFHSLVVANRVRVVWGKMFRFNNKMVISWYLIIAI